MYRHQSNVNLPLILGSKSFRQSEFAWSSDEKYFKADDRIEPCAKKGIEWDGIFFKFFFSKPNIISTLMHFSNLITQRRLHL